MQRMNKRSLLMPGGTIESKQPGTKKGWDVSSFYKGRDKDAGVGWVWFGIITPTSHNTYCIKLKEVPLEQNQKRPR